MARHRFRWTRERYRKAQHLARFFSRWMYDLPSETPRLLQRYFDLWERHPQRNDQLLQPLAYRYDRDDIPF